MNLYSFFRKKHSKPFVGAFFAAAFLSAFFAFNSTASAERQSYKRFSCLFETLSGETCSHATTEAEVKSGIKSGIAFDKVPSLTEYPAGATAPETATSYGGIKAIRLKLGLVMDPKKEDSEKSYFWSRIADDTFQKFVVRISYTIPTGPNQGKTIYWLDRVGAYQYISNTQPLGQQPVFSFYKDSDFKFVSDPAIRNKIIVLTGTDSQAIPYGSKINADFWYCGGLQDNVANGDDGRYSPKSGNFDTDRVEYFTTDGKYEYEDDNGNKVPKTDGIKYDTEMCGGDAAYKIGQTIEVTLPSKDGTVASQGTTTAEDTPIPEDQANAGSTLPVCHILNGAGPGEGTFMGCIAYIGYGIYNITAWIAGILGKAMDFFLGYSISDESYRASVVVTGWKLVRDISNIFFIIILVWTGFATVFNLSSVSMKKVVPGLIINALLINFSLFGTQVIIDISNITARLFYNTMSVCNGKCEYSKEPGHEKELLNPNTAGTGGYKPLSEKIVDSFDPQKIFKPGTLNSKAATVETENTKENTAAGGFNSSGIGNNIESSKTLGIYDSDYAIYFLIVSIIAAFIMIGMAKMFFGVMFMFVGRVVGLYMSMIFSPFAVLTRGNMPLVSNIKELSWSKWISDTTNYALLAPIFVFFLYIIYAFINSDMLSIVNLKEGEIFMSTVISVVVPMIIIYMLIQQGVSIAKKYAGTAGEMIQKYATQATGIVGGAALGVATGGAAIIGRNGIGRVMGAIGKGGTKTELSADGKEIITNRSQRWAANANNNWLARKWNNTYSASQTSSFDIRNAGIKIGSKEYTAGSTLNSGLGKLGINMKDQVSGAVGLGQDKALGKDGKPGGNVMIDKKRAEAIQKDLENKIKMSHLSDDEAKAAWEKYKAKKVEGVLEEATIYETKKEETKVIQTQVIEAKEELEKAKKEGTQYEQVIAINKFNAINQKLKDEIKKEEIDKIDKKYGTIKDNKSFVTAMRAEYAEGLDKKTFEGLKALKSGILAGLITAMIPGLTAMSGLVGGAVFGGLSDSVTGARAKAIKAMIDKANKTSGKGNPLANLEKKVNDLKNKILESVNDALKNAGKDEYKTYDDLENSGDLEDGLAMQEAKLAEEIDALDKSIKSGNLSDDDRKKAYVDKQKKANMLSKLKNAIKDLEQANKNLSDLKEKQKEKEDKEAEKNKPKDK